MIRKLLLPVNLLFKRQNQNNNTKSFGIAKCTYCVLFFLITVSNGIYAQKTWTGGTSSDWHTDSNWNTNGVPTSGQSVTIPNTTRKPVISGAAVCASLTITNTGSGDNTLTINASGTLVVSGTVTLTSPTNNSRKTIINVGSGSLSAASITLSNSTNDNRDSSLQIGTGTVNVTGNIAMSGNQNRNDITFLGSGTLNIGGTITGGSLIPSTGTVNYNANGGTQAVRTNAYNNLTLSGSGTKTFAESITVSGNWSMTSGVLANLGGYTHTSATLVLGGAGPLRNSWGSTASGASNTTNDYFTGTGIIDVSTAPYPAIDNNYASYTNGISGEVAGSSGEYANPPTNTIAGSLSLAAPVGSAFINVKFASYGSPGGTSPNFTIGTCHAFNSRALTTGLLGNNIATIPAFGSFNDTFGDPCYGVVKSYNVVATFAEPFCTSSPVASFIINGSTPTGGNNTYTFLWEVSTAPSSGYSPASGINNAKDYTVPAGISQTTYYRRTVTSGIYSDATIVIVQVTAGPPVQPTAFTSTTNCDGTATLSVSGGSLGLGGYVEFYSGSCNGTVVGTSNVTPVSLVVSPTTGNTTYFVRYKNSCNKTAACRSTTAPNTTVSISAAASATSVCFSTTSQTASLDYTATTGSPDRYSITWNAAAITAGLVNQTNATFASLPSGAAGTINTIAIPANVPAGTYTGTLTVRRNSTGCMSFMNVFTVTINAAPTLTAISIPAALCSGGSLNPSAPTVTANGAAVSTSGWQLETTVGGNVFSNITLPYTVSYADNSKRIRYYATNGCGTTYSNLVSVTVNAAPTLAVISTPAALCSGGLLSPSAPSITTNGATVSVSGWQLETTVGGNVFSNITLPYTVSYADNSKRIRYYATNGCGTTYSNLVSVTVNAAPTLAVISTPAALCSGGLLSPSAPSITTNGATVSASGWQLETTVGGNVFSNITLPYTVSFADNSKRIRYYATNGCGTTYSNLVSVTVNAAPTLTAISTPAALCSGGSLNPSAPTVTANGAAVSTSGWQLETTVGGNVFSNITLPYTVSYADNSKRIRYYATNGCGTTYSNLVSVKVNAAPTLTAISTPAALCSGGSLNPSAPTVTANGAVVSTSGWQLETAAGSSSYSNITLPYTVSYADNGKRVMYYATNSCGITFSNLVLVTVNAAPTLTAISTPAALCSGGSLSLSAPTVTANGATVTTSGWQLETAVGSSSYSNVTIPYAVSYADNGKRIQYYATNSCGIAYSNPVILVVNPTPAAPTVGTITNISCIVNTGSIELTGLPSGSWTINQTGTAISSYTGTTSDRTITGLAAGTYTFTVTNDNVCSSIATIPISIINNSSTEWNGTIWSNDLPSATKGAIISSVTPNTPFTSDFTACSLTINAGVVVTVPSGVTLNIINAVTTNGQLIFENNSSLIQDPATTVNSNSGNIVYKRSSTPMKNFDFSYWSSPVANQNLYVLSPNTLHDKYMSYTGTGWKSENATTTSMDAGKGYIIRVPKPNAAYPNLKDSWTGANYVQTLEFDGIPNNGNIEGETISAGNFYLIGNPYPSALDADSFLSANNTILNGTVYFWTHITAIQQSGAKFVYASADYASYNGTGGVATSGGAEPTGFIAAGQSFFGSAKTSGTILFNNTMRVPGNNNQFFKPGKTSKTNTVEKHRLWLNMTNDQGAFKQTLIGYISGATNAIEGNFDGVSFDGNSFIDFYSVNDTRKLAIQGRGLPFEDTDKVPMGYRSKLDGNFTIAIDKADGLLANQKVYLEDTQSNTVHDLTASDYTFTTVKGTFNNRFVVTYSNKTLGSGEFERPDNTLEVVAKNKIITISSGVENISQVFVYDVSGKQLYEKDKISNLSFITQNLNFSEQVLLVKVVLENGNIVTRKIIFR